MDEDGVDNLSDNCAGVVNTGQTDTNRLSVRLFPAFFLHGRAVEEERPQQIARMPSM